MKKIDSTEAKTNANEQPAEGRRRSSRSRTPAKKPNTDQEEEKCSPKPQRSDAGKRPQATVKAKGKAVEEDMRSPKPKRSETSKESKGAVKETTNSVADKERLQSPKRKRSLSQTASPPLRSPPTKVSKTNDAHKPDTSSECDLTLTLDELLADPLPFKESRTDQTSPDVRDVYIPVSPVKDPDCSSKSALANAEKSKKKIKLDEYLKRGSAKPATHSVDMPITSPGKLISSFVVAHYEHSSEISPQYLIQ